MDVQALSLEQKVGQLFMATIDESVAKEYESCIRAGRLCGGLLSWDKFTAEEARDFSAKMQAWSAGGKVPFLIAVDHEGGSLFTQHSFGTTIFPGNMALGATRDPGLTRKAAEASGRELRAMGAPWMDFAPVVDVNSNPKNPIIGVRSFGEDPQDVAAHAQAAVEGYKRAGVLMTPKHYPGHGDTETDSHLGLPKITRSRKELEAVELLPFKAAIKAGAPAIMPAHIVFSDIDDKNPVTLSKPALDMLRKELKFQGVIVSDSMDMGAITKDRGRDRGEAAVLAVQAGCDVLLLGKATRKEFEACYDQVLKAVKDGRISEEQLNGSVQRVLAMKTAGVAPVEGRALKLDEIGQKQHQLLAQEIAEKSVTLLRNDDTLIPLRLKEKDKLLVLVFRSNTFKAEAEGFAKEIASRHENSKSLQLAHAPDAEAIKGALKEAESADALIVGTFLWGSKEYKGQVELVRKLQESGKPLIIASLLNPYDLKCYPETKTTLCTYGMTPASLCAAARLIFGEIEPQGKLPVTIADSEGLRRGDGLKK